MDIWLGSETLPIHGFLIRAIIVYVYIFLIVKVVGQRSMGSIDALDFIFGVVIGDILGEPLTDGSLALQGPITAAATIAGLHLTLSMIALKTPRFRRVIEDEPIILARNGVILHQQLRKVKVTLESFMMDMRLNGASDLSEVDYAVLEMNGQISVIKKSAYDSATPNDLNKQTPNKGYPSVIIEDGQIIHANLKNLGTIEWLRELIHKEGYKNPKEIFLMTIDESGKVYISPTDTKDQIKNGR
ncbi:MULTISPECIES: DUF421 domain-containing protein [Alkalihalophilus]|uniref:YetF C-terminal domain-containing protein n=1 Tax=Alkalihalophilus pseudofirmus (strain ATCC BAA-2126 / JCM 17055 / OF4) TaxID=398511 RepID=D3FTQ9_ALKPO|nr:MULTISPECIES: DUF421 domain-containing protein [Alkalihalophilus]ADC51890.1 hypothetical protein BpOF4_19255 [Alkalihalophilus pseudofirmus OF4]MEC2073700.1 DUF421 domain-containing protein [Alkalihalophilus marmarensis]MED1599678.1 DUF421 domain-containing protein [Alkalihalophilus marmarensis]WEG15490.1 DUF421 domain-containing protein [Alkalihalophilus pseudofirmus]